MDQQPLCANRVALHDVEAAAWLGLDHDAHLYIGPVNDRQHDVCQGTDGAMHTVVDWCRFIISHRSSDA
jgi:hypothetical protein